MNLKIEVLDWAIPTFGNKHYIPYGTLFVSDGKRTQRCKTKGDTYDEPCGQYVIFNKRRYSVIIDGGLYSTNIRLEPIRTPYNPKGCTRNGYKIKHNTKTNRFEISRRESGKTVIYEEYRFFNDAEDWAYMN